MSADAQQGQKRVQIPLELELEGVVSSLCVSPLQEQHEFFLSAEPSLQPTAPDLGSGDSAQEVSLCGKCSHMPRRMRSFLILVTQSFFLASVSAVEDFGDLCLCWFESSLFLPHL